MLDYKLLDFDKNPLLPLLWLAGLLIGVPIASIVGAVFVRLGAWAARVPAVSFSRAWRAAMIANFVLLGLIIMFWANAVYFLNFEPGLKRQQLAFWFSPSTFFLYVLGLVLLHATVFGQVLPAGEEPLRFGRASLAALVYISISAAVSALVAILGLALAAAFR